MKNNPLISVILPVYNAEKYLKESIESILNQTYKNFEFIIINDGSKDNSEKIIKSYNDKRIKYYSQSNKGLGETLKYGCEIAKGKYIARMDADDISLPTRFEKQVSILEKNTSIVLVSSAMQYIDEGNKFIGRSFVITNNYLIKKSINNFKSIICHPCVMFRKSTYELTPGYQKLVPMEDLFLWLSLAQFGKFILVKEPLLKYRVLNSSVSRSITKEQTKSLMNFLRLRCDKDYTLSAEDIKKYNNLYLSMKDETQKYLSTNQQQNVNALKGINIEEKIYFYLKQLKLNDRNIEFIISNLKNIYSVFLG